MSCHTVHQKHTIINTSLFVPFVLDPSHLPPSPIPSTPSAGAEKRRYIHHCNGMDRCDCRCHPYRWKWWMTTTNDKPPRQRKDVMLIKTSTNKRNCLPQLLHHSISCPESMRRRSGSVGTRTKLIVFKTCRKNENEHVENRERDDTYQETSIATQHPSYIIQGYCARRPR